MILDRIAESCEKRPKTVIIAVLIVTLILGSGILKIEKETDMMSFLPKEKESVKATLEFTETFGGQNYEMILLKGDVTSPEAIAKIEKLENEIRAIPNFALDVTSYVDILKTNNVSEEMMPVAVKSPELQQKLKDILTEDGKAALIRVRVNPDYSGDIKEYINILKKYDSETLRVSYTGELTRSDEMLKVMDRDNRVLLPSAILLIFVVLFLTYRRLSDVFLPFLVIIIALIWVLGIMGHTGIKFSNIFVGVAPLLLGVAIAYTVHVLNRYYEERNKGEKASKSAVISVKTVGVAVLLTAVTTAFGFGSFAVSDLPPLRNFGMLLVLGILFSFLLVVTLMPSLLVLRDRNKTEKVKRISRVNYFLDKVSLLALRHRKVVIAVIGVITLLCVALIPGISTSMNYNDMLPKNSKTISTQNEISETFGTQGEPLVILVKGDVIKNYREVLALENEIRSIDLKNEEGNPIVLKVFSYADALYQTHGDLNSAFANPQTAAMIGQTLVMDRNNPKYLQEGIVLVYVNPATDKDDRRITEEVRDILRDYTSMSYEVGGAPPLIADIMGGITSTQIKTTLLALILSLIVVTLLFRSLPLGIFSVLPLGFTIAWEFGVLKLAGWDLDIFTVMVSALIVGIGIDFSIHVIHRYREEFEKTKDAEKSVENTVLNVGKALISATLTTAGSFFILSFSSMSAMARFGSLVAIVIVLAFAAALFGLPSILVFYYHRKTKT